MTQKSRFDFPKVSVIIPLCNAESTIGEAIQSVQDTGWPNLQIVVVDDASTDRGPAVVRDLFTSMSSDGWDCVFHGSGADANRGAGATRNLGVTLATGKYLSFLDADDLYLPNRFDGAIDMLEADSQLGAVFGTFRYQIMSVEGRQQVRDIGPDLVTAQGQAPAPATTHQSPSFLDQLLAGTSGIHTSAVTIRSEVFQELGMFPHIPYVEDQALWLRLLAMKSVAQVSREPVSVYRIHEESLCSRGENMPEFIFGPVLSRLDAIFWLRRNQGPRAAIKQISRTIPGRLFAKYGATRNGSRRTQVFMLRLLGKSVVACPAILLKRNYWAILIRLVSVQLRHSR